MIPAGWHTSSRELIEWVTTAACWIVVSVSWVAITLAELGRFSAAGVLTVTAILLAAGYLASVPRNPFRVTETVPSDIDGKSRSSRGRWVNADTGELLFVAALLVFVAFVYFRPADSIFGTDDAGLHMNAAAHIAQSGQIPIVDPTLPALAPTGAIDAPLEVYDTEPFIGHLLPQFSGAYEADVAIALGSLDPPRSLVDGYQQAPRSFPEAPFYVTPLLGVIGLLALFGGLRLAFNQSIAMTATAALALSYPEIYFARLTMAEIATQAFCAIGLYGFAQYGKTRNVTFAVLSGLAVGLAFLTHVDAFLLVVPLSFWLAWLLIRRHLRSGYLVLIVVAATLFAQGCWHYLMFEFPYIQSNFDPLFALLSRLPPILVGIGGVAIIVVAAIFIWQASHLNAVMARPATRRVAAGLVAGLGVFAYVVRPLLQPAVYDTVSQPPIVQNAGITFVLIGEFLGPATLALALVGVVSFIATGRAAAGWVILSVGAIYLVIFGWNALVSPHQPFWVRRFLPEAIPTLVIFASIGASEIGQLARHARWNTAIVTAARALLLASVVWVSLPIWTITPLYQGGLAEANALAQQIPPAGVTIVDRPEIAHWLPLPLTFLFNRDSYVLTDRTFDQKVLADVVSTWQKEGKPVTFVTTGGARDLDPAIWSLEPLADQRFRFPEFDLEFFKPPTTLRPVDFHVSAYRLTVANSPDGATLPSAVTVGGFDFPSLVSGFYPNDYAGDVGYRYTDQDAAVDLPRQATPRVRIDLRLGGQRPDGTPPASLLLLLDGSPLGTIQFQNGSDPNQAVRDYSFLASAPSGPPNRPVRLELKVNSWRPSEFGLADARDLGVAVFTIRISPAG